MEANNGFLYAPNDNTMTNATAYPSPQTPPYNGHAMNGVDQATRPSPTMRQKIDMYVAELGQLYVRGLDNHDPLVASKLKDIFAIYYPIYDFVDRAQHHMPASDPKLQAARMWLKYIEVSVAKQNSNNGAVMSSTMAGMSSNVATQQQIQLGMSQTQMPVPNQFTPANVSTHSPEFLLRLQQQTENKRAAMNMRHAGSPAKRDLPAANLRQASPFIPSPPPQLPPRQHESAANGMNGHLPQRMPAGQIQPDLRSQTSPGQYTVLSSPQHNFGSSQYIHSPSPQRNVRTTQYMNSPSPQYTPNAIRTTSQSPACKHIPGTNGTYRLSSASPTPTRVTSAMQSPQPLSSATPSQTVSRPVDGLPITYSTNGTRPNAVYTPTPARSALKQTQVGQKMSSQAQGLAAAAERKKLPPPQLPGNGTVLGKRVRIADETTACSSVAEYSEQPLQKRPMIQPPSYSSQRPAVNGSSGMQPAYTRSEQALRPEANVRLPPLSTQVQPPKESTQPQVLLPADPEDIELLRPIIELMRPGVLDYDAPTPYDYAEVDPRDLDANTTAEQDHVWAPLTKTRYQYLQITGERVDKSELHLEAGYNRAYYKLCLMLTDWLMTHAAPGIDRDRQYREYANAEAKADERAISREDPDDIVQFVIMPRDAPPGYVTQGTRRRGSPTQVSQQRSIEQLHAEERRKEQRNKMLDSWFQGQSELMLKPKEILFKLEKWSGEFKHYGYAPNLRQQPRVWKDGAWTV